ncbi:MAG TPA: phage tail protein [Longimicrobium sp.]|nr:phage tail protein [Longimicrobium sp.]
MSLLGLRPDPLTAFRFLVTMEGEPVGAFSEVTGLAAEVEVLEVPEGGENGFVHKLPGRAKHGNLTLRRGVVTLGLWRWFAEVMAGRPVRRTISVVVLPGAQPAIPVRFVFDSAVPVRWTGPELKAEQSAVAVETVELAHHGFIVEGP